MKKKYFTVLLTAALVLSLNACKSKDSVTSASAKTTSTSAAATEAATTEASAAADETKADEEASAERNDAAAELKELLTGDYNLGAINANEKGMVINFYDDSHTNFRQATGTLNLEQMKKFATLDWSASDYNQQVCDVLASSEDLEIVTPEMPDMAEYKAYEGKTVGDMEDDGFDFADYDKDADGKMVLDFYAYTDDGDTYTLRVIPDIADDDDTIYDDDSIRDLTVKEVIFWNFS